MKIEDSVKLDFSDVLIKPRASQLSSRKEAILEKKSFFKYASKDFTSIPVIAANMDTTGTFEIAKALADNGLMTALTKHYTVDEIFDFFTNLDPSLHNLIFVSIGISDHDWKKYEDICDALGMTPNICIDVANGYMDSLVSFCQKARSYIGPDAVIMAGNVVTGDQTIKLINAGVDVVKVGIGSGAQCTTRIVAGVGYPQLSAVIECSEAALSVGGAICSDGGITCPGDLVKAFAAGSDFVMVGSEFAGHDESGGEDVYDDGVLVGKITYGMSSSTAMNKYYGKVSQYRSSEGRTSVVPYRGPIINTVLYYLGGLRSGMSYVGARTLDELNIFSTFIRVNRVLNEKYEKETLTKR